MQIRENAAHSLQLPCSRGPEGDKRTTEGDGRGLFRHGLSSVFALPFPAWPEAVSLLSPFCDEVTTVSVFSGEVRTLRVFCVWFLRGLSVMFFEIWYKKIDVVLCFWMFWLLSSHALFSLLISDIVMLLLCSCVLEKCLHI